MDHISNFIFVLVNSAYLIPAAATFLVLGFALGYFNWAKSARRYRELQSQVNQLEAQYGGNPLPNRKQPKSTVSTRNRSIKPTVSTAGFSAGAIYGLGKVGKRFSGEQHLVSYSEKMGVLYKEKPLKVDDLTELAGIDRRTASRMNKEGIYTFKQIETLNPRQRKLYESKFKLTDLAWVTSENQPEATDEAIDLEPPELAPEYIKEIESETEPEIKPKSGLPQLGTPALSSSKPKQTKVSNPVKLVGADTRTVSNPRVEAAIADMGPIGERFHGEEDRLALDDELGLVYEQKPEIVDDLTMLKGIDSKLAEQINQSGIYTFKQFEAMSDSERLNFETLFDIKSVKWERWGLQLGWGGLGGSPIGFGKMISDQMPDDES